MSEPHEHEWTLHQNVTTKGYALPPYRVCAVCGRAVRLPDAPPCADEVSSLVQSVRDHAATMRKLATVEGQRDLAWEAKARVRALHSPDDGGPAWCVACQVKYPCQTIRALDGPRP